MTNEKIEAAKEDAMRIIDAVAAHRKWCGCPAAGQCPVTTSLWLAWNQARSKVAWLETQMAAVKLMASSEMPAFTEEAS